MGGAFRFLRRLSQVIPSTCAPVRYHPSDHALTVNRRGFSLLELLVTITLIAALVSLVAPSWTKITGSHARRTATSSVMETLERARGAAIAGKKEVWVIFRHPGDRSRDSLRIVTRDSGTLSALGPWLYLPPGLTFHGGSDTLMEERPSPDVIKTSLGGTAPGAGDLFGNVMFQRSGRVGLPMQGGNQLMLRFDAAKGPAPEPVILSRASGRATCSR